MSPLGRVVQVPADEPNAFAPETPPSSPGADQQPKFNAFDRGDGSPSPRGAGPAMGRAPQGPPRMGSPAMGPMAMPRPPMGPMPMPPRPPMPPPMVDRGVPSGMANAFTLAGSRRPIPADFGGTPQEPNGFGNAEPQWTGPGSPPRPYPIAYSGTTPPRGVNPLLNVPPAPAASGAPALTAQPNGDVSKLLATLKESMYPSQREWAAEQLGELNWRKQPHVVESLTKSAREDLAATVRAACVRALGHMKVSSPEVAALVRDLKSDRDSRVRREAEEVLSALGTTPRQDSGVQQASHK